jgi:hypothetical protein
LRLGKMVVQGPISDFDTQSLVEYMTTGTLTNRTAAVASPAGGGGGNGAEEA